MAKTILLVTGMSGAGKTEALKCLEDIGYQTIDNMPLRLVPGLVSDEAALPARLALGIDVRNRDIATHMAPTLQALRANPGVHSHIVFLTADDDVLVRRFSETRRRHPLHASRPVIESIALEKQVLHELHHAADTLIDTSAFKAADLRRHLTRLFDSAEQSGMAVFFMSFGFKNGIPKEADMVFDVRFLRNPHYDPVLKPKTGREADVQAYIRQDPNFAKAFEKMADLIRFQLPLFAQSGKAYMTIAFGCTGGQHRSVMVTELMAASLSSPQWDIKTYHRDIPKI